MNVTELKVLVLLHSHLLFHCHLFSSPFLPPFPVSIFEVYIILNSGISVMRLEVAPRGQTLFFHVSYFLFHS